MNEIDAQVFDEQCKAIGEPRLQVADLFASINVVVADVDRIMLIDRRSQSLAAVSVDWADEAWRLQRLGRYIIDG